MSQKIVKRDDEAVVIKTTKQLEKEAKKLKKLEKLNNKIAKQNQVSCSHKKDELKSRKLLPNIKTDVLYHGFTLPGSKKDISCLMPDSYNPKYVEAAWYSWWEASGYFKPEFGRKNLKDISTSKGIFSMVIPPPNVTGKLHLGHALTNAVEDAIARWHRMKGKMVLWNPGSDHAGIATQVVVEKNLWKQEGLTRHSLGRAAFIERVWKWKEEFGGVIYDQLRALGSSVDWTRACFTMDDKLCRAVTEAFVRLHDEGIIYRSNRLVNWSCSLKSAISDVEVDKLELEGGRTFVNVPGYDNKVEFGVLHSFAYKVVEADGSPVLHREVVVATTRLETMLGDTAVAVHPLDQRYSDIHGKFVRHPYEPFHLLPIICDDICVDPNFGTGAVKITPAHDPNDYECGKRHNLPFRNIFTDDGKINHQCPQLFSGMKRFDARLAILASLESLGLYRGKQNNPMVLPICSRSKDIVEPMMKPQWYVKCADMAVDASNAVKNGHLKIRPQQFEKTWYRWMDGIRDWCISRQLWWGHRIPAYLVNVETVVADDSDIDSRWISGRNKDEAVSKAAIKFGVDKSKVTLVQDEDVLDTWFSSALFPFSIFGWPDHTPELELFYPGSLLETGHDIIFFWVARMVFFGQKLMGKLPFKEVFLHAMVRDSHGRKMSKSLGNIIDPLDVIRGITLEELQQTLLGGNLDPREVEKAQMGQAKDFPHGIPECGTDALKFALCAYTSQSRDINLDVLRVQGYRFFCNKIWNASKFAMKIVGTNDFNINSTYFMLLNCFLPIDSANLAVGLELNNKGKFLGGQNFASNLDAAFFNALVAKKIVPCYLTQKSVCVWYHRMNSLTPAELLNLPPSEAEILKIRPSLIDRWILSRLAALTLACNKGFEEYNFPLATTALYNFWLYELCDVYIECIKPILEGNDLDGSINTCRHVLMFCIDSGLRLLSPFMPFISEELFQRLCLRDTSICVSPYPEIEQLLPFKNELVEADVEFVQKLVAVIRSTRSSYDLSNKTLTDVHFVTSDPTIKKLIINYKSNIATLAYASKIEFGDDSGRGCAIVTVSDKCTAYIQLKGVVDVSFELGRLEKKKVNLSATRDKFENIVAKHSCKIPEEVKKSNFTKLAQVTAELEKLNDVISTLKHMM